MKFFKRNLAKLALAAGLVASTSLATGALAQETIKIGAPFNVTGALSSLDAPALNGAKLKAKEINDAGGINGKQIELVIYDTKTDPDGDRQHRAASSSTRTRCRSRSASPIPIRCWRSGRSSSRPACPSSRPAPPRPSSPTRSATCIFLACFGDNVQAAAGADFVTKKLNGKTAYLLRDIGAEYTTLLAQYFDEAFTKAAARSASATTTRPATRPSPRRSPS